MTPRAQQLRHIFAVTLLLFVCGVLAISSYTLWRLRSDAIKKGLEISAMHTRGFEDFLTQNLHVTELISANILHQGDKFQDLRGIDASFSNTLQHAPFLRSMSLLDEKGHIFASSNPANVGIHVATQDYLPIGNEDALILRIGRPWTGRDFSGGRPSTSGMPVETDAQSFIPITRPVMMGKRAITVLFAINPDYFINHVSQKLSVDEGIVGILRYDGTLLMSTDPSARAGSQHEGVVSQLHLADTESGSFEKDFGHAQHELTSFRSSRLYPFVVITHLHRDYALQNWRAEAETLLAAILPTLIAIIVISIAFYRRQVQIVLQRAEAEHALRRESEKNLALLHNASDGIHILDPDGNVIEVSDSFCDMLGYSRDEMIGMNVTQWDATFPANEIPQIIRQQLTKKGRSQFETRHKRKDGSIFDVEISGYPLELDGKPALFNSSRDITERKKSLADLNISAAAFESQDGILVTDANAIILRANSSFSEITGYSTTDVVGKNPNILSSGRHDADFYSAMWESLNKTGAWKGEIWNRRKDGAIYPERLTITAVKDAKGEVTNYVASFTDITQHKAAEQEIQNLAFFDPLTQLPNRRLLMDRLQHALTSSARSRKAGAILFIDLDNFKNLNDTLGHDIGDQLLISVAQRLEICVREGDTVARLGGDEFVVMLEDLSEDALEAAKQTESIAAKILSSMNVPYHLGQFEHHSTPSIGAALFTDSDDVSVDDLLKHADIAMYQAKKEGRNTLRFFDPKMQESITTRASLENELRKALAQDQFHLFYQPQVDDQQRIVGAEALIRWQHPIRGIVSPLEFIPLAEENGLILPIGRWVLETACAKLKSWEKDPQSRDIVLAVNVSAKQLRQADFAAQVQEIILRYQIDPSRLKLELTESMLHDSIEDTILTMIALKQVGVRFSLDDFGTGYSSLQYIKRLPLDQLKIDRSFVSDIVTDIGDKAIVTTIVAMARSLDIAVIAEGVETEAQSQLLLDLGCRQFQGYLFGKPVRAEEFDALLKDR
jgi:diguanylate cyclase (GGDEF)-like protein/PAS domain S-box-containing protein